MTDFNEYFKSLPIANIKVIGVGGGGSNAVSRMVQDDFAGPEFIAVNTDKQALMLAEATTKVQIGIELTNGLGAGADPKVGTAAAEESKEDLGRDIEGADHIFITAGMGGGTGTGAAPVIAQMAKEKGILTIAVVTKPFGFEGRARMKSAELGIENLKKFVDTLVIIPNEKLNEVMPKGSSLLDSFYFADKVLRQGIQGVSDLILKPSMINLDFADIRSVMKNKGYAHMGIGRASGENRMTDAVRNAVASPLLETRIEGATGVLLNVKGGMNLGLDEVTSSVGLVRDVVDPSCNLIFGTSIDENIGDEVEVTIIATGFNGGSFEEQETEKETNFFGAMSSGAGMSANAFEEENNFSNTFAAKKIYEENEDEVEDDDLPPFLRKLKGK